MDYHKSKINSIDFSDDGKYFLTSSEDGKIVVWDIKTLKPYKVLIGHNHSVLDARFSSDGQQIVSASRDHTVKVWKLETEEFVEEFSHGSYVSFASFTPNGETVVSESNGKVYLWDVKSGYLINTINGSLIQQTNFENKYYALRSKDSKKKIILYDPYFSKKYGDLFANGKDLNLVVYIGVNKSEKEIVGISESNESFFWSVENLEFKTSVWEDTDDYNNISGEPGRCEVSVMSDQIMILFDEDDIFVDTLSGIKLHGVDLTTVNSKSMFTNKEEEILAQYGAII